MTKGKVVFCERLPSPRGIKNVIERGAFPQGFGQMIVPEFRTTHGRQALARGDEQDAHQPIYRKRFAGVSAYDEDLNVRRGVR